MAVAVGQPGNVLALDTRNCSYQIIVIPKEWTIAVVHSGIDRALADGRYKVRREECLQAASALGVPYLCDGDPRAATALEPVLSRRAAHVISEGRRSLQAIAAIKERDSLTLGRLMNESHASLRDYLEVSVPEIDAMVRDAVELGAVGARITGAGFGGCFVCLVHSERAGSWWSDLNARHPHIKRIS